MCQSVYQDWRKQRCVLVRRRRRMAIACHHGNSPVCLHLDRTVAAKRSKRGSRRSTRHGDYMYHDKASDSRPVPWFIFCQRMRLLRVTTHALLGLLTYSTNIRALTGWVSSAGISIPPGLCAELLGICSQARITYIPLSQSHLSMILRNGVAHRSCSMPFCRRAPCRTQ